MDVAFLDCNFLYRRRDALYDRFRMVDGIHLGGGYRGGCGYHSHEKQEPRRKGKQNACIIAGDRSCKLLRLKGVKYGTF